MTGDPGTVPVGAVEIAGRLGVRRGTVDQWQQRGLLPDPDWTVGGRPAWAWHSIEQWAHATGRLRNGQDMDDYGITEQDIRSLDAEAGAAGDGEMARICRLALDGDHDAVAECARVITEARERAGQADARS